MWGDECWGEGGGGDTDTWLTVKPTDPKHKEGRVGGGGREKDIQRVFDISLICAVES